MPKIVPPHVKREAAFTPPPEQPKDRHVVIPYDKSRRYDFISEEGGMLYHLDLENTDLEDYSGGGGLDYWEERERWEHTIRVAHKKRQSE